VWAQANIFAKKMKGLRRDTSGLAMTSEVVPCANSSIRIPDGVDASLNFAGQILPDYTAQPISSG
jgi:hypothetical protein